MADATPATGKPESKPKSTDPKTPKPLKGTSKTANGATRKDN